MPNFQYEIDLGGDRIVIAGVDEVGRGSLAGPLVAAAVVFDDYKKIISSLKGIQDSKKLGSKVREELDLVIREKAADFAIGEVSVSEIDKYGVGAANVIAFQRALDQLKCCDLALIDGRKFRGFKYRYVCIEKGDNKSLSIAAASIIAKVYRDRLMQDLGAKFPEYCFDSNKGYGGKKHYETIKKIGPSPIHRQTFLRWLDEPNMLF